MIAVIRLGMILLGAGGAIIAAILSEVLSKNPPADAALEAFGLGLMLIQAVVCVALLVAGVWLPIHHWLDERRA